MDKQVLSIEEMQELIDLGIDISKANCCWCKVKALNKDGFVWVILPEHLDICDDEHMPTLTLLDILEMLHDLTIDGITYGAFVSYTSCRYEHLNGTHFTKNNSVDILKECIDENSLKASFNMLKWCKQNNYI